MFCAPSLIAGSASLGNSLRVVTWLTLAAVSGILAGKAVLAYSGTVCVVEGQSMVPTFSSGDRVVVKPVAGALSRGDIVLVNDTRDEYALKRIVALPGETIELWRGYVFVNRHLLKEPYLRKYTYTFPDELSTCRKYTLGQSEYFVLGDNREVSVDSRRYGPVCLEQIAGRVRDDQPVRAELAAFTLPVRGKRTIRPD